jgi:hypothetical protein
MPCPSCGSHYLWDDNLAWGCRECPWMCVDGHVHNNVSPLDTWEEEPPEKPTP